MQVKTSHGEEGRDGAVSVSDITNELLFTIKTEKIRISIKVDMIAAIISSTSAPALMIVKRFERQQQQKQHREKKIHRQRSGPTTSRNNIAITSTKPYT